MDTQKLIQMAVEETRKLFSSNEEVAKATIGISQGQFGISLEQPAKQLIPFMPTWAQRIPRATIGTGSVHQYKRITGVSFNGKSTAAEGTRGNAATLTTDEPTVTPGNISSGVFDVTLEAEKIAGTFDDALARATSLALLTARRSETAHILGGNRTALGQVANVTCADNTSVTSTLTNAAHYVYVRALTAMAVQKAILARAVVMPDGTAHASAAGIDAVVDQSDGYGAESTVATATPTANKGMLITWDAIPGAAGYAVFAGLTTGIANCKCQGIVGQTRWTLTALSTGGTVCGAAVGGVSTSGDQSADSNDFNGLLALLAATGSGAYKKNLGATLSAASGNGIPEIDTMLASCYLQQLGIDSGTLIMGIMDRALVTRKLGAGAANSILRVNIEATGDNSYAGATYVDAYIHPITGRKIKIETDPNLFAGTILWVPDGIPYVAAEVEAPLKMWLNFEWLLLPYAMVNPKREYEARMRGGLACYLPPAFGMLYNIYNG